MRLRLLLSVGHPSLRLIYAPSPQSLRVLETQSPREALVSHPGKVSLACQRGLHLRGFREPRRPASGLLTPSAEMEGDVHLEVTASPALSFPWHPLWSPWIRSRSREFLSGSRRLYLQETGAGWCDALAAPAKPSAASGARRLHREPSTRDGVSGLRSRGWANCRGQHPQPPHLQFVSSSHVTSGAFSPFPTAEQRTRHQVTWGCL